ncbi:hypothetical protein [Brachybacterium sp. YJGR34]|uniref:hypothetical protein n=1 Tax=Brachybacterium sp. YJGR34 TaxID=2059911 RepID=UPI001E651024|nr:hypothetical protein [Brachybacterium sp. YJGR34]
MGALFAEAFPALFEPALGALVELVFGALFALVFGALFEPVFGALFAVAFVERLVLRVGVVEAGSAATWELSASAAAVLRAPARSRRCAAARAMSVARSRGPGRPRCAAPSARTSSPEKNMSTGRVDARVSGSGDGRVRVRSSGSGAGVEPAPGIRAPSPRPSPRFCVMAVVLPRNVVTSREIGGGARHRGPRPIGGQGAGRVFSS